MVEIPPFFVNKDFASWRYHFFQLCLTLQLNTGRLFSEFVIILLKIPLKVLFSEVSAQEGIINKNPPSSFTFFMSS